MKLDWRSAIVGAVALLVLGAGGWAGNNFVQHQKEIHAQREAIRKSVAENTAGVKALLELELKDSSVTYKELFDRGDERVKAISDAEIPIEASDLPSTEKAALRTYMEDIAELVRSQASMYHHALDFSNSLDTLREATDDLSDASYYSADFELSRAKKARTEVSNAMGELQTSTNGFATKLTAARTDIAKVRETLKGYAVLDEKLLTDVAAKTSAQANKDTLS